MIKKTIIIFLISFNIFASIEDMKLDLTVLELVSMVCSKIPLTSTRKCVDKKMKCINRAYGAGLDVEKAVYACF